MFRGRQRFYQNGRHVQEHCCIFTKRRQDAACPHLLWKLLCCHTEAAGKTPQGDQAVQPSFFKLHHLFFFSEGHAFVSEALYIQLIQVCLSCIQVNLKAHHVEYNHFYIPDITSMVDIQEDYLKWFLSKAQIVSVAASLTMNFDIRVSEPDSQMSFSRMFSRKWNRHLLHRYLMLTTKKGFKTSGWKWSLLSTFTSFCADRLSLSEPVCLPVLTERSSQDNHAANRRWTANAGTC